MTLEVQSEERPLTILFKNKKNQCLLEQTAGLRWSHECVTSNSDCIFKRIKA